MSHSWVILGSSFLTCHSWNFLLDVPLLTCHFWLVALDLSLLIYHSWLVTLDLPLVTCYSWHATCDMPLLTCHFWVATFDLPPLTCYSWHVTFENQLLKCHFWQASLYLSPSSIQWLFNLDLYLLARHSLLSTLEVLLLICHANVFLLTFFMALMACRCWHITLIMNMQGTVQNHIILFKIIKDQGGP